MYIIFSKLDTGIKLDTDIQENILGFHGQTACDTSSSFSGTSKIKTRWKQEAQKLLQSSCKFCLYGNYVETENLYIDLIQINIFFKARKELDHLQKMPLNCTV